VARPICKWLGGKTALLPELLAACPEFRAYHEPFAGGAALFWALEERRRPIKAYLSDSNVMLIRTYQRVQQDPGSVVRELRFLAQLYETQDSEDLYYRVRDAWNEGIRSPARFLFLKATSFNGLWRVNQAGKHNAPWGHYEKPRICDPGAIYAASKALQCVVLQHQSWRRCHKAVWPGDLVYFDPPYVQTFDGYTEEGFPLEEHIDLLRRCRDFGEHGVHVIYSNAVSEELDRLIEEHWPEAKRNIVHCRRAVNRDGAGRQPVAEYLLTS